MLSELVILLMIVIKERNNYRCRDSDAEIRMLRGQMPEVSGKARHSCARDRFGGQGTARPSCAACVVEAVVSTACRKRIVLGVCVRRRSVPQERYNLFALRRYAIGERVGVKIGVITQTRPWAVLLCCVCDAGFLTFGKIVPRIVSSNGEEGPIGTFQVLHKHVAGCGVAWRARHFAKHFFQLLAMAGGRTIIRDRVNRTRRLRLRVGVNAHGAREFFP